MRKIILFCTTLLAVQFASAQYCGTSSPSVCTAGSFPAPGLYPQSDSLPPVINGTAANTVIQFKNFNQVLFSGFTVTVNSLKIDSIENLPAGLCWSTNKTNNTFANQENGCIRVSGTTCSAPGQYKLRIIVTVDVGITRQVNADDAGLRYYVRVNNRGQAAVAVDTTQTSANPFISYNTLTDCISLNATANHTVCSGTVDTIHAGLSNPVGNVTFNWTTLSGNTLSCVNCANPIATITQNSVFAVSATDSLGITVYDTVAVSVAGGATVITASTTSFCTPGGAAVLSAPSAVGNTYVWRLNGSTINGAANINTYSADASGRYDVVVTINGACSDTSNAITVTANPTPTAAYTLTKDTFCTNDAAFTLTGGTPAGGTYTIDRIQNSAITPAALSAGTHTVTYTATGAGNCKDSVSHTFIVKLCTGIDELALETGFSVYPNPANNVLNIQSELFSGFTINPVVFDLTGKAVSASFNREATNRISINTTTLAPGAYLVKFNINGQSVAKRFIISE